MAKREKQKADSVKVIVIRQPWGWLIVNGYTGRRESQLEDAPSRQAFDLGQCRPSAEMEVRGRP